MTLLTNEQLDQKLVRSPAPRVTKEYIESRIAQISFHNLSTLDAPLQAAPTLTICNILIDNGFSVRGESSCVNPENYDKEIGEKISYDNAFRQLWYLFGFLLAENNANPKTQNQQP